MKSFRNRWVVLAGAVAVGVMADFASKLAAVRSLTPGALRPFLGNTIQWTLIFNRGAIFSFDPGDWIRGFPTAPFFIVLTVVELMVVVWFYGRMDVKRNRFSLLGLALVAAGAAGNLVDRLLGRPGVVDFIRVDLGFPPFDPWPIFNVADICITLGVALVLLDSAPGHDAPHPRQSDPPHGHRSIGTGGSQ
ncbi:MAG: signal peptidase II [Candidatus Eisenbacteria bacterium]|nr:signal peptidase II [Candidatus Eisenbacteria bacterium]